jgi:Uma2 family endonuclease
MSSAIKYLPHYTVHDYRQWEGDWELWNGIPVAMTPSPFGRHQWIAGQILSQINRQIDGNCKDCFALGETDWVVNADTVVRPDVVTVCGSFPERFIESAPSLIVEVTSDSTEDKDRTAKLSLYQLHGVSTYVIIDPKTKTVRAFRLSSGEKYEPIDFSNVLQIQLHPDCQIELHFNTLFNQ